MAAMGPMWGQDPGLHLLRTVEFHAVPLPNLNPRKRDSDNTVRGSHAGLCTAAPATGRWRAPRVATAAVTPVD